MVYTIYQPIDYKRVPRKTQDPHTLTEWGTSIGRGVEENRRCWHLGTGTGQWGTLNVERTMKTCSGMICANSNVRRKQLAEFQQNARSGDKIFLHVKGMVQYVGIYTGECWEENKESPCPLMFKLRNCKGTAEQQKAHEKSDRGGDDKANFILVDSWKKLQRPFPGEGKRATLYESPSYSDLSQFLENI